MKQASQIIISLFCFFNFGINAFAANDLTGEWKGQYLCAQGLTNLTISLKPVEHSDSIYKGTLYFYPHSSNPYVARGKHTVKATILDNQGGFEISPVQWIVHPKGYNFFQLYGSLVQDGAVMKGMVNYPGCKSFFAKNENFENSENIEIPRSVQSQMSIDRLNHNFEQITRNRSSKRAKKQPIFSSESPRSQIEPRGFSNTGFFEYEVESGLSKICFYNVMGDLKALNANSTEICPTSHQF